MNVREIIKKIIDKPIDLFTYEDLFEISLYLLKNGTESEIIEIYYYLLNFIPSKFKFKYILNNFEKEIYRDIFLKSKLFHILKINNKLDQYLDKINYLIKNKINIFQENKKTQKILRKKKIKKVYIIYNFYYLSVETFNVFLSNYINITLNIYINNETITYIKKYLNCFDKSKNIKINIYIDFNNAPIDKLIIFYDFLLILKSNNYNYNFIFLPYLNLNLWNLVLENPTIAEKYKWEGCKKLLKIAPIFPPKNYISYNTTKKSNLIAYKLSFELINIFIKKYKLFPIVVEYLENRNKKYYILIENHKKLFEEEFKRSIMNIYVYCIDYNLKHENILKLYSKYFSNTPQEKYLFMKSDLFKSIIINKLIKENKIATLLDIIEFPCFKNENIIKYKYLYYILSEIVKYDKDKFTKFLKKSKEKNLNNRFKLNLYNEDKNTKTIFIDRILSEVYKYKSEKSK